MMRKVHLCLLIFTAIFSTACPKYRPSVDFNNRSSLVNRVNERFKGWQNEYYDALKVKDFDRARRARNELLEEALPYIDDAYTDFITDIQRGRDRTNFVADVIELGTTAAVGITNGQRSLHILGVALTAFRGGRRSADLNFYKDQSTPILISKMDGNRANVRATILTREKASVDDYSIGAAVTDIVDYYNAGTLVRAFTELSKDTAVQTKQAEDKVLELKGVQKTPEATQKARDVSVLALNILDKLRDDLKDPAKAPAATTKLQNIIKALEADPEMTAVLTAAGVSSSDTDGAKLRAKLLAIKRNAADKHNSDQVDKINQAIVDNGQ
jgi:hypothetical protein